MGIKVPTEIITSDLLHKPSMDEEEELTCETCEHVNVLDIDEPCVSCYGYSNWEPRLADMLLAQIIFGEEQKKNR